MALAPVNASTLRAAPGKTLLTERTYCSGVSAQMRGGGSPHDGAGVRSGGVPGVGIPGGCRPGGCAPGPGPMGGEVIGPPAGTSPGEMLPTQAPARAAMPSSQIRVMVPPLRRASPLAPALTCRPCDFLCPLSARRSEKGADGAAPHDPAGSGVREENG